MRKLMWFAVGFAAACALCACLWITEELMLPALAMAAMFAALMFFGRKTRWLRIPGVVCLGCAVGLMWFQLYSSNYLGLASALDGQNADVTARCTDYSYRTDYGTAVEGVLYLEGKPFRCKFYVSGDIAMEPGDVLQGVFRMKVTTPDGSDSLTVHQGKGIFLLAYQEEDAELLKLAETPTWAFPAVLRQKLLDIIGSCFPEDAAGFTRALLLGDRTGIDYETNTAFKVSGISHIIAVSGLHVTILFTLINMICLKRRWFVALLGIPTLCLFAAVGGFSPSIVRACIMQGLIITAMLFDREYDGPTELAFACLVMLMVNPLVIVSVSFQLSVGCMAGIFLFQRKLYDWMCWKLGCEKKHRFVRLKRWFASSVSMTLSAMSLTTPMVAYYFGCVSLVGVLTNLLTLWVISFIFYGIMLVCLLGWLWPTVGVFLGNVIALPVRYVLFTAKTLASFPLAAVYTRSVYITVWLIFVYVLFGVFLLSRKKRPGIMAGWAALGLCLALTISWAEVLFDGCRVTVLDVGQGQCIILQSEGKSWLVDCGGSNDEKTADLAAETLLSQGITRLDGIILTHYDRDHSGGLPYLLTRIDADIIFAPESEEASGITEKLDRDLFRVQEDLELRYTDTSMTIFGPVIPDSGNESSLAVLFQSENCDILITGDRSGFGERMLLKRTELPELEILVAGHHGSKNATCTELLEATKPKIAVISVGENSYGHPAPEVLDRLEGCGCAVYRTDVHGNLVFRR